MTLEVVTIVLKRLLLKEPFYGFFMMMLNKRIDNSIQTLTVRKLGINYELLVNEEFFLSLPLEQREGVLVHELLHIMFGHLTSFDFEDRELANIACDLEINQYIEEYALPDNVLKLTSFPELYLEPKKGSRYYYQKLKEAKEKKQKEGSSGSSGLDNVLDDGSYKDMHDWKGFDDLTPVEKDLFKQQSQRVLKEAREQVNKSRGYVPGFVDKLIEIAEIVPPKFNWKNYLKRFVGQTIHVYNKKTRRKENKRFSENPGLKSVKKSHILLAVDTSGSVSVDELKEFMNEMYHIYKSGHKITLIQCDTVITSMEEYKGKNEITFSGRGGTSFDPVLEYYDAHRKQYTSLIYFTDGECSTHIKPKGNILWVLSNRSSMNKSLPGKVIKLEI